MRADALAVCILVMLGWVLGARYVNASRRLTRVTVTSSFNHRVFGAALMSACGRGLTTPAVPIEIEGAPERQAALIDFLAMRRQAISCTDIPADVGVDGLDSLQRASRYLIWLASTTWTVAGPTWLAIDWLLGALYAASIAMTYFLCRLAMGRVAATSLAALYMLSPLHLAYLPDLRDYSKVPFFLASLLIVGLLATRRRTAAAVVGLAALAGGLIGFGFGMRTDVVINLILVIVAVVGFLPQPVAATWKRRLAAAAVCVCCFTAVAYPIITAYRVGIPIWHVALLGYSHEADEALDVAAGPYEPGYFYSDSYVATIVDAFWSRMTGSAAQVSVGLPSYPEASRDYYLRLQATFPADSVLRAWAALIQVLDLPFSGNQQVPVALLPPWLARFMGLGQRQLSWLAGLGVPLFVMVVLVMSVRSVRLATLTLLVVLFFGAYPSIQFQSRHIVHLEVLSLWMLGLTASSLWVTARQGGLAALLVTPHAGVPHVGRRPLLFGVVLVILVSAPLAVLRIYQQRSATALLSTYEEARTEPISLGGASESDGRVRLAADQDTWPPPGEQRSIHSEMLVIDLSAEDCPAERPTITFLYRSHDPSVDFTRRFDVAVPEDGRMVRVFFPVFETGATSPDPELLRFAGVDVDETEWPCVKRVDRFAQPDAFPLLLPAVLPADWRRLPLHQTLRGWETPALHDEARHVSYWAPTALRSRQSTLIARMAKATQRIDADVEYRARIARTDADRIVVEGVADDTGSYLVAWKATALASQTVIVAEGTLDRGGFTIGLVDSTGWVAKIDVQAPGPFRTFVGVPHDGRYQVVVANHVRDASSRTHLTISRMTRVDGAFD